MSGRATSSGILRPGRRVDHGEELERLWSFPEAASGRGDWGYRLLIRRALCSFEQHTAAQLIDTRHEAGFAPARRRVAPGPPVRHGGGGDWRKSGALLKTHVAAGAVVMALRASHPPTMVSSNSRETLHFRDFALDVAGYQLRHNGRPVRLERQPMDSVDPARRASASARSTQ